DTSSRGRLNEPRDVSADRPSKSLNEPPDVSPRIACQNHDTSHETLVRGSLGWGKPLRRATLLRKTFRQAAAGIQPSEPIILVNQRLQFLSSQLRSGRRFQKSLGQPVFLARPPGTLIEKPFEQYNL